MPTKTLSEIAQEINAQAANVQALKNIIIEFCLRDMAGKGCANCVLNGNSVCWLNTPSITELKAAVKLIKENKNENQSNTR